MKKIEVGQAITIFANLGVIAGIIFLAYELRQTRITLQDSSQLSSIQLSQDSFDRLWEPDFASSYLAGLEDLSSLSDVEKLRFEAYVYQRINLWEYAFYSYQRGAMEEEIWLGWDFNFRPELRHEAWREVWRPVRDTYGASFRAHVDAILAEY